MKHTERLPSPASTSVRFVRFQWATLLLGMAILACASGAQRPKAPSESPWGTWKAADAEEWLQVTPREISWKKTGRIRFLRVLGREEARWQVRNYGLAEDWILEPQSHRELLVTMPTGIRPFRRASPPPGLFKLNQFDLRDPSTVPPLGEARVKEIQNEFERRRWEEQKAVRSNDAVARVANFDDNTKFLLALVAEVVGSTAHASAAKQPTGPRFLCMTVVTLA